MSNGKSMIFTRPKPDANADSIQQRYTELSDAIRARNKVEDSLLNTRLKYYEREKKIRLNVIRREQYQLEQLRRSLSIQMNPVRIEKQTASPPPWTIHQGKSEDQIVKPSSLSSSEFVEKPLESKLDSIEFPITLTNDNYIELTAIDHVRRHTTIGVCRPWGKRRSRSLRL